LYGDKAPVAKLVDVLLFDALTEQASDIHVPPYPDKLIIRYRIDGVLHNVYTPDPKLYDQIVGRIKVIAGMDVAEKRLPQDGRISVTVGGQGGRQIDLRVSTLSECVMDLLADFDGKMTSAISLVTWRISSRLAKGMYFQPVSWATW
jgi:type II secretory ATPase GspE/PulE/Tfp pilus assembly ATPase PilB-like protein